MSMKIIINRSSQKNRLRSIDIPQMYRQKKNSYFRKINLQSNLYKKSMLVRRSISNQNFMDQGIKRSFSYRHPKLNNSSKKRDIDNYSKQKSQQRQRRKYIFSTSVNQQKISDEKQIKSTITQRKNYEQNLIGKKTERKQLFDQNNNKKNSKSSYLKLNINYQNNMKTLQDQSYISNHYNNYDHDPLQAKQQIIKNCIEQLQGVLKGISKKKHGKHRRLLTQYQYQETFRANNNKNKNVNNYVDCKNNKENLQMKKQSIKTFRSHLNLHKNQNANENQNFAQNQNGKNGQMFDQYVKNIKSKKSKEKTLKNDIKKVKRTFQKIKDDINTVAFARNRAESPRKIVKNAQTIEQHQIECSSIDKINQSSFLSQCGKKIIKQVSDNTNMQSERQSELNIQIENRSKSKSKSKKKKVISKGFLKVKSNFPVDFF